MATFNGRMSITGESGSPVPVHAQIGTDQLVLQVDGVDVGSWSLGDVLAEPVAAGVALQLGGERVTLELNDRTEFLHALQPPTAKGKKKERKSRRQEKREPGPQAISEEPKPARAAKPKAPRNLPSLRTTLILVMVAGIITATILATELVGAIALLVGIVLLAFAAFASSDARLALRLPFGLQVMHVLGVGVVLVVIGITLVLIG